MIDDGAYTYTYDADGNQSSRTHKTTGEYTAYGWDHRNRLISVEVYDSPPAPPAFNNLLESVSYSYDYADRRIARVVETIPTGPGPHPLQIAAQHYIYNDLDQILLELFDNDAGGSAKADVTHRYAYGPLVDQVLLDEADLAGSGREMRWALADHQGTVRDLMNNAGVAIDRRTFDSFGRITSDSNAAVDELFGFTGQEYDAAVDLYYYNARWYDADTGRFLGQDPAKDDLNPYRYVGNDAPNATDPTGLQSKSLRGNRPSAQYTGLSPSMQSTVAWASGFGLGGGGGLGTGFGGGSRVAPIGVSSSAGLSNPWSIQPIEAGFMQRARETISPYMVQDAVQSFHNFAVDTLNHPALQNSGRFGQGMLRAVAGGVGTFFAGAANLAGVPYAGDAFDASAELARRGVYDMGASFGWGGKYYGETTEYATIEFSSAAQFMEDVRLRPGVSPQVRMISQGSEVVGGLAWDAALALNRTQLGKVNLRLPEFNRGTRSVTSTAHSSAFESQTIVVGFDQSQVVSQFDTLVAPSRATSGTSYWWPGRYAASASQHGAYQASGGMVFPTHRNSGLSAQALRSEQEAFATRRLLENNPVEVIRGQARQAGLTVFGRNERLADRGAESAIERALQTFQRSGDQ